MPADLIERVLANPLLPTSRWQSRCAICRLLNDAPEAYSWVTRALMGMDDDDPTTPPLTQVQIAEGVSAMTGLRITQGQVSTHRRRHFDPTLADALESFVGSAAMVQALGGMPSGELAVAHAKMAITRLSLKLQEAGDAREAAALGNAVAALSRILVQSDTASAQAVLAQHEAQAAELRAAQASGEYAEAFAGWVRQHYPDLEPLLADPARLRAALDAAGAGADSRTDMSAPHGTAGPEEPVAGAEEGGE